MLVRGVRLYAPATTYRAVHLVDLGSVQAGAVTLKALKARAYVDGLAVLPV